MVKVIRKVALFVVSSRHSYMTTPNRANDVLKVIEVE